MKKKYTKPTAKALKGIKEITMHGSCSSSLDCNAEGVCPRDLTS